MSKPTYFTGYQFMSAKSELLAIRQTVKMPDGLSHGLPTCLCKSLNGSFMHAGLSFNF